MKFKRIANGWRFHMLPKICADGIKFYRLTLYWSTPK